MRNSSYRRLLCSLSFVALSACAGSLEPEGATGDFVGSYVAAVEVARDCPGLSSVSIDRAGEIAANTQGVRRQAVLASLYYSKTDWLKAKGTSILNERGVNAKASDICRFGNGIVNRSDDPIGRFLRAA